MFVCFQVARQFELEGLAHYLAADYRLAEASFRTAHDMLLRTGTHAPFDEPILRICRNMAVAQCKQGPTVF